MARDPLPPADLADLCEAYRAGAGLRPLSKEYRRSRDEIRELLVGAGVEIRPPNGDASREAAAVASAEREARVRTVAGFLVDGITNRHEILETVNSEERKYKWGVELSTVDSYLTDARALLSARYDDETEKSLRAMADARLERLYRRAWSNYDVKTALAVLDRQIKFRNLDPATKIEHSGSGVVVYIPDNGRDPRP